MGGLVKRELVAPGLYRHFKGGLYEVRDTVIHSETLETYVYYRPRDSEVWWIRPYAMFCGQVEHDGRMVPRFELIQADL